MGIERNNRKPKRLRTTAQRMKGRMKTVLEFPESAGEKPAKSAGSKKKKASA